MNRRAALLLPFVAGLGLAACGTEAESPVPPLPETLAATGLYADAELRTVAPECLPYSPQYPLWTDGATKRRWIRLPEGAQIDARDPEAWVFPIGTKLWKEFAFNRPVETRYLEKLPDGSWRYAAYVWSADGREARLAPAAGVRRAWQHAPGVHHGVPSRADCRVCHESSNRVVLGFDALQLSADRDPLAPHAETPPAGAVDLPALQQRGLLRGLPAVLQASAPRIAARGPRERAALGYLYANCAMCHTSRGALAELGLSFELHWDGARAHSALLPSALGQPSRFALPDLCHAERLQAGAAERSVLWRRSASRSPLLQMPPLGTVLVDAASLALLRAWIDEDLPAFARAGHVAGARHD